MKTHWLSSILLVFSLLLFSLFISLIRESAMGQGQPSGISATAPQVLVRLPVDPPKYLVDFSPHEDPLNPARKITVITVVDPESKRIAVYHEDKVTGQVKLLSVRNIQNDLLLDQFNAVSPTPSEIEKDIRRLRNQN